MAQRIRYYTFVTKTLIMKNDLIDRVYIFLFLFKEPTFIKLLLPRKRCFEITTIFGETIKTQCMHVFVG